MAARKHMAMRITDRQIERAQRQGEYELEAALYTGVTLPPPPQHIWRNVFRKQVVTVEDMRKLNYQWFLGYVSAYKAYLDSGDDNFSLQIEKHIENHIKLLEQSIEGETLLADTGWPPVY